MSPIKKFMDELAALGVDFPVANQMVIDDFQSITDFNGLTAERLMAQYPLLKFGTAHRLCVKASIPRLVVHDEVFGVPKVKIVKAGELHGSMLAGQDVSKDTEQLRNAEIANRVGLAKFDIRKHGDRLVKLMEFYYRHRSTASLRDIALRIGIQSARWPEVTLKELADDMVAECNNNGMMGELFQQLTIDVGDWPEMANFLSQFLSKVDTRVKFDLNKHGDQLMKKMLDYYGSRTSLRNVALEIGLQLEPSFDETVTSVAQDLLRECINSCRLGNLFRQLAIDFDGDPGMTNFLSQFLPENIR